MNPKYPVFVPTKGRAESRLTIKMFDRLKVPYTIFIEEQDFDSYSKVVDRKRIHVVPHRDKGVTVTRNYIWNLAEKKGYEWFWTFDDNIRHIYRLNNNLKIRCGDGSPLAIIEDFTQRYENIAISGMQYTFFAPRIEYRAPYILNTRVYSNMLINTFAKDSRGKYYRNETFYNEDTDHCLRVLEDKWCTVLFNAFLIEKQTTMVMKGGNTEYYKTTNKRLEFVRELQARHPKRVQLFKRWGRWHHLVNFGAFKHQLRRKPGVKIPDCVNEHGLVLQERIGDKWVKL